MESLSVVNHTITAVFEEDGEIVKTSPVRFTILKETYRLPETGVEYFIPFNARYSYNRLNEIVSK